MMTSLRVPVWDDTSIKFAMLSEGDDWTQSAFVRITDSVTNKALERANERMSNVQYLRMSVLRGNESVFSLIEKAAMPNLRALRIDIRLGDHTTVAVANALRNNPQVEQGQVQLLLQQKREQSTISLFDALSSLPLTALSFDCSRYLSQQLVDRFCVLLHQKRNTLVSLEIVSGIDDTLLVNGIVSKGLHGLRHLKLLRFPCSPLDKLRIQDLCKAMESMPHLATLRIIANDITALLKFFNSSFRPITAFESSTRHVAESLLTELLHALKKNTRLRTLKLSGNRFHVKCVLESGLADEGFLTRVIDFYTDKNICSFDSLLKRNTSRHAACKLACVALIVCVESEAF
jgi:hypothetical protein